MSAIAFAAGSLFASATRLYVAPVDRANSFPMSFDPASMGRFPLDAPPAGWLDGGAVLGLERLSDQGLVPVLSGAPAAVKTQVRSTLQETVQWTFPSWTRIAMALSSGAQTMNLLQTAAGAIESPSGGTAVPSIPLLAGSTASVLQVGVSAAIGVGDVVVVDVDYMGSTGYLGSGAPGFYVQTAPEVPDPHYTRRMSFNVGLVADVTGGAITLAQPLLAGVPTSAMKVDLVRGFVDRAAGGFVPEWSALLMTEGVQGDRLLVHYPRLQPVGGSSAESATQLAPGVDRWRPQAKFRALPVTDPNGGDAAVCFRTYLPAPMRAV
ncbi:hypothetical protein [Terriglobus roseus]|uniref:Uncharacterized protein n=1 Tax=Terriglobus roseus TaxID=392734 RepID=A0A1H4MVW9_9BACT|nr:hypothetical protein [Terriglobus roseus]SEB87310.1 hypothetical protein SAMN05443244_2061 [Terriglobus roseus]